jgi:hypothetical protein
MRRYCKILMASAGWPPALEEGIARTIVPRQTTSAAPSEFTAGMIKFIETGVFASAKQSLQNRTPELLTLIVSPRRQALSARRRYRSGS